MSSRVWLTAACCACALGGSASAIAADKTDPNVRVVEEIVAKVNGNIITRGELEKRRQDIRAEMQARGTQGAALDDAVNKQAAQELMRQIDQLLLVEKGKDLNINVDAEVNRKIADMQSASKIADTEKFHDWVRENSGESFEDYKKQIHDQAITARVLSEEVWRNVTVPRAEMEKYYNDHKADFVRKEMVVLREILISTGDHSADKMAAAEKKAKSLTDRARKGEKFADLARQNSDAPTALSDGELGSFQRGQMRKELEDVVFTHDKGYVTDPILTPAGYEILRVDEHYAAGQASFDEVSEQINGILAEPLGQPKVREYLTKLRMNAFLQIKAGYDDAGAAPGKDTSWKAPDQLRPETTTKEQVAAEKKKKFLHVIPYGGYKDQATPAAPPAVTPVQQTPVPVHQQ